MEIVAFSVINFRKLCFEIQSNSESSVASVLAGRFSPKIAEAHQNCDSHKSLE
jgi:hypothetical protein